ncbi:MAG: hypothetical protein HS115_18820 [Spirochaetales bacterium]|nr:hypothetical protein [Spirochaetales bacterium]
MYQNYLSKYLGKVVILCMVLPFVSCTELGLGNFLGGEDSKSKERNSLLAALLLLQGSSSSSCACQLGNACFTPSSGVTCSGGSATGTGTLTSDSPTSSASTNNFVSLEVTVTLAANGSNVILNTASSAISTNQVGIKINHTGDATAVSTATEAEAFDGAGTHQAAPGSTATTYCMESHAPGEGHVMLKKATCPTGTEAANTVREKSGLSTTGAGNTWGFRLNNATISSLTRNSSKKFTE